MSDRQDIAEGLDDDRIGDEYPPEEPLGAEEYGVTGAEQRWDEPLEERVDREEPDPLVDELGTAGDDPEGEVADRTAPAQERVPDPAEEAAVRVEEPE